MNLLLLVPGLISLYLVLRGRVTSAFLNVYLPCLLCVPDAYSLRLPHFPPASVAEIALLPLGCVAIYRLILSDSFALMDLLVVLYTAGIGLSEILHAAVLNDGIFSAIYAILSIFLAYVTGRKLIEPSLRLLTVRRFVALVVILDGISGFYEWRMGVSPYGRFGHTVLHLDTISENLSIRNGHARMGVALGGGELAGIAFAMTFCLNTWLVYLRRAKASVDLGKILTTLEKYHVPGVLLPLFVFMTGSRGPLMALGAGFLITQITRFKSTRMMTIMVAILLVGVYLLTSSYFDSYTVDSSATTEEQTSVLYRKEMNKLYPPIAEKGGWTGYGSYGIPQVNGLKSIDNSYLLVHLTFGRLGYYLFILIVWESIRILLVRSWQFESFDDRAFAFSLLGAMAVLWFTLLTVFMGGQLPQIAFLLVGWMQSIGKPKTVGFSFQRVFT